MYKITTVVPTKELKRFNKSGNLVPIEGEVTTTVITTSEEGDAALRIISGFFKLIADGTVKSLTVTKEDDTQTEL